MNTNTEHIQTTHSQAIAKAQSLLQQDGVVVFPTDTVYGIGVRFDHPQAIQKLFAIKGRNFNKPIAILTGNVDDFQKVAHHIPLVAYQLAEAFLPGPLTLIVPKHPHLPNNLSQFPTIGIRIPNHPFAIQLLNQVGPLAVTSANLSGQADTTNATDVLAQLGGRFDLLIDGGQTPGGTASTVVDLTQTPPAILRTGPITKQMINRRLASIQ